LERKKEKEKQKRAMTKKVVGFSNPLSGCKLPKSTNSEYASSKNISWKRTGKPSLDGSVALHATEPFPKKLQMEQRKKRSSLSEGEENSHSEDKPKSTRENAKQKSKPRSPRKSANPIGS